MNFSFFEYVFYYPAFILLLSYFKFTSSSSGLSSTVEIIAVHVGIDWEANHHWFSLYEAFQRFLSVMEDIGNAQITFTDEEIDGRCRTFYDENDIEFSIWQQTPLVLDPVDPYNNRLSNKESHKMFVSILAPKASESLRILNNSEYLEDEDAQLEILCALQPGPFDACLYGDVSNVMETPERLALTVITYPR